MNIGFQTTNVSITVQWDAISNQHVDRYIVNWTDGTNPMQSDVVHKTSYTVTGLNPNTTYTITVAAVNRCGTGAALELKITTNLSISDPTSNSQNFGSIVPTSASSNTAITKSSLTIVNTIVPTTTKTDATTITIMPSNSENRNNETEFNGKMLVTCMGYRHTSIRMCNYRHNYISTYACKYLHLHAWYKNILVCMVHMC